MIPATTERVLRNTSAQANEAIFQQMHVNVARYASATPTMLDQRLRELDQEWDVERVTSVAAGLGVLAGVLLASLVDPAWLVLPAVVASCLLLHGLVGWSPGLALLRRLGYRTAQEIDHERYALKALRGDFQPLAAVTTPQDREDLARFEGEGGPPAETPGTDAGDSAAVHEALRAARS